MKKESEISKTIALVLIILTVMVSATSTWMIITSSMDPAQDQTGLGKVMVFLNILKGPVTEPVQTDQNTGDVQLFIAENGG